MIEHLSGRLTEKSPTFVVVDVQGVGYGLSVSLGTYERLPGVGEEVRLITHLYVREDRMELYGFHEERERALFRLLMGVPGIGPNLALTVLSGSSLDDLSVAISQGRTAELTAIKGIGRKTAERMILDLRDKVGPVPAPTTEQTVAPGIGGKEADEAEMAMVALGISAVVARRAISKVQAQWGAELTVQELIKRALRER